LGGNKGPPGAASEDSEEVGEVDEGVVEVAASSVIPFNPIIASSPEFVGGVEGEID
jgi:hypothetical protein